jgi:hypothetical protein
MHALDLNSDEEKKLVDGIYNSATDVLSGGWGGGREGVGQECVWVNGEKGGRQAGRRAGARLGEGEGGRGEGSMTRFGTAGRKPFEVRRRIVATALAGQGRFSPSPSFLLT